MARMAMSLSHHVANVLAKWVYMQFNKYCYNYLQFCILLQNTENYPMLYSDIWHYFGDAFFISMY